MPFFSISGSEFVEMFVGVGAARVRDLFHQATERAPAIVFIDELDAMGRARGAYPGIGGHDEKEQTLNQLLVELDGFDPRVGVVLLAATNRPEILDPALLRAGRFDRQVLVDRPDRAARRAILALHLKKVRLAPGVDADRIAELTPGLTGADLANLVNEAALLATRRHAAEVDMNDINEAIERSIAGLARRSRVLQPREREMVAFHEMGHALVAMSLPGTDPVHKVSIIPRGVGALGYTIQRPTEDRYLMTREELENRMAVLLGGRAAEMLVFDTETTGAADDLQRATDMARAMVARFGMVDSFGPAAFEKEPRSFLGGPAPMMPDPGRPDTSEATAQVIDELVRGIVRHALDRAVMKLRERRELLERTARTLLERETLSAEELARAGGGAADGVSGGEAVFRGAPGGRRKEPSSQRLRRAFGAGGFGPDGRFRVPPQGQLRAGADPQHPAERAEQAPRLRGRGEQGFQLRAFEQRLELAAIDRRLWRGADQPGETTRQRRRGPREACRPRPPRGRRRGGELSGAEAGDQRFEPGGPAPQRAPEPDQQRLRGARSRRPGCDGGAEPGDDPCAVGGQVRGGGGEQD